MNEQEKQEHLKACPAFGVDADGGPGCDPSTDDCQQCKAQDPKLYGACETECLDEPAEEVGLPGEEIEEVIETVKKEVETDIETVKEEVVTPPAEPKVEKPKAKKGSKKSSRLSVIADIVNKDLPLTTNEIAEKTAKRVPQTAKQVKSLVLEVVNFGIGIGALAKDGDNKVIKTYNVG